jgi:hypothetical protein
VCRRRGDLGGRGVQLVEEGRWIHWRPRLSHWKELVRGAWCSQSDSKYALPLHLPRRALAGACWLH